jgi:hypothetical protein
LLSTGIGPIEPNPDDDDIDKEEGIEGIDIEEVEGIDIEEVEGIDIEEVEGIEKSKPSISV